MESNHDFLVSAAAKDRDFVLYVEDQLINFVQHGTKRKLDFPGPLNSYQRLIIHRMSDEFDLAHVVDTPRRMVIVYRRDSCRVPSLLLRDIPAVHVQPHYPQQFRPMLQPRPILPTTPRPRILSRDVSSVPHQHQSHHQPTSVTTGEDDKAKEYVEARTRIFSANGGPMHQAQQEVVGIPRGQVDFRPPNPAQQGYYQGGGYYDPGQYYQQGYNNGYQPGYGGYYGGASGGYYAGAGYGGYQDETVFYPLPQAAAVEEKRQSVESEGVEEIKQSIKDL